MAKETALITAHRQESEWDWPSFLRPTASDLVLVARREDRLNELARGTQIRARD